MSFYHDNEERKAKYYRAFQAATNPDDTIDSIKGYVKTLHFQSIENWRNNNKSGHPDFETYFTHWIYSSLDSISYLIDKNIFQIVNKKLKQFYQKPIRNRLPLTSKYFE